MIASAALSPAECLSTPNQARNSCPGPLDPSAFRSSDFFLPEEPKAKLPPPSGPPHLLQYPAPDKVPGLQPCTPSSFPPVASAPALLQEEPRFSARFPFPAAPQARGASPLPAPTAFPATPVQPIPGPVPGPTPFPIDPLSSGYPEPSFSSPFAVPQGVQPRGKPLGPPSRERKASTTPTLASATTQGSNPCLTQLLRAGKRGKRVLQTSPGRRFWGTAGTRVAWNYGCGLLGAGGGPEH